MNERHLETILSSEAFNFLWSSAKVVTIALEPYYCGFEEECIFILDKMNSIVLNKCGLDIKEKVTQQFGF